jgi:glucose/arabinose dehydrogenase
MNSRLKWASGLPTRAFAWARRLGRRRSAHRCSICPRFETLEQRQTPTTLPTGFTESPLVSGLSGPTTMEFAPDGRLFVLEQGGDVELVRSDGTIWTALHLNVDSAGERGLLGIAFDPGYETNHFVYLYYTNPGPGAAPWAAGEHNQLSRFTVDDADPQRPTFTDEAPILDWNTLSAATNHNGGAIHFGLDGMLYAAAGDNEQTFAQDGNIYRSSQSLASLLGKQLRIDVAAFDAGVATRDDATVGHLIPADNPFVGTAPGINQLIYALGLRNPFTFAVQPGTGTIFINDVGEATWEEVDRDAAGANFGWSGGDTDGFGQSPPGPGTYTDPILAYNHAGGPAGGGIAIVGGAFYNPGTPQFPASYVGKYFYADLGGGWIRVFDPADPGSASNPDTSTAFASNTPGGLRDLKVDPAGNLWYLAGNGGVIGRISYASAKPSLLDAGFESPTLSPGSYQYAPTGTPWSYAGSAGVAGNGSGFTSGNPNAPEGAQVGFLQGTGAFSQDLAGLPAGSYRISFQATQRANYLPSQEDLAVLVDGVVVGTFTPAGTSYAAYSTGPFVLPAGSHTVTFQGLDSVGGDNTAFLDNVQLTAATPDLAGGGFEVPFVDAGSFNSFQYAPTGTPWSYAGSAGVAGNGSGFTSGNPNAPEGTQVGFLQTAGSFSQTIAGWAAGTYQLSFAAAQRGNYQAAWQDFQVLVDGAVVGTFTPSGTAYTRDTTAAFAVAAGAHTITFRGLDSAGGDNTALVDDVRIAPA